VVDDGRDEEFTAFVRDHGASLLRTAVLLTGERALGEDLVQTALARAYGKWVRVSRADVPVAYVRRLMVNSHLSWRRRLASGEQVLASVPDRAGPHDQDRVADSEDLRRSLLQLSPRMRTAVVLRYFEDLSQAETAQLMGCSVSTVNNHVTRGLAVLRDLLGPHEDTDLAPTTRRRP
jgi:RNA polymerase sigma-70 factor (sigma-E family)